MLEEIRTALRIITTALDGEIQNDIDACIYDLTRVGILPSMIATDDPTVIRLCELYTKAAFNFEDRGEAYDAAYEKMRNGIALDMNYLEA